MKGKGEGDSSRDRMRRLRARERARGIVDCTVRVPVGRVAELRAIAARMVAEAPAAVLPGQMGLGLDDEPEGDGAA